MSKILNLNVQHIRYLVYVVLVLLIIAPWALNPYKIHVLNTVIINVIVVLALNLVMGYAGQFAKANVAFMGLGAYAMGLLVTRADISFWIAWPAGALFAALAGTFSDGGSGGSFSLSGGLNNALNSSSFTSFPLTGNVASTRISNAGGTACTPNCPIIGRTDLQVIGPGAQGVGGAFNADSQPATSGPVFGVSGTYVLEQLSNLQQQGFTQ